MSAEEKLSLCIGLGSVHAPIFKKHELQYARLMADTRVDSFVYGKGSPQAMSIASAVTPLRVSLPEHSTFCQDVQSVTNRNTISYI